jgi:hypothetical protein
MGGEWLGTVGKTHSELNANLHSSLDVAEVQLLYCHQMFSLLRRFHPFKVAFADNKTASLAQQYQ